MPLQQLSLPVLEKKKTTQPLIPPPVDQVSSSLFGVPPRHLQLTPHGRSVDGSKRSPLADNQLYHPPVSKMVNYISDLASTSLSTHLGSGHTNVTGDGVLRQQQKKQKQNNKNKKKSE